MFSVGGGVDAVDGVDDLYDILHGNSLVGTKDDTGASVTSGNAGAEIGLELGGHYRYVVLDIEVVVFVDVDGHTLLGHSFAVAFGEQEFHRVGTDERGGNHEEDEQQEHKVAHGGGGRFDFYLVLSFDHNGKVCCVGDVS